MACTTNKRTNKRPGRPLSALSNEVFLLVFLEKGEVTCFSCCIGCPSRRKLVLHVSPFPLKYDPSALRYDTFPRTTQFPCSTFHLP